MLDFQVTSTKVDEEGDNIPTGVAVIRYESIRIVLVGAIYEDRRNHYRTFTVRQIFQDAWGDWRVFGDRNTSRRKQSIKLETLTASYRPTYGWPEAFVVVNGAGSRLIDPMNGVHLVFASQISAECFAEDHMDALRRAGRFDEQIHTCVPWESSRRSYLDGPTMEAAS